MSNSEGSCENGENEASRFGFLYLLTRHSEISKKCRNEVEKQKERKRKGKGVKKKEEEEDDGVELQDNEEEEEEDVKEEGEQEGYEGRERKGRDDLHFAGCVLERLLPIPSAFREVGTDWM